MNRKCTSSAPFRSLLCLALLSSLALEVHGQHVEVGGFGDYENSDVPTFPQNAFGLGGRLDINIHRFLQTEFEMAYDVKHAQFVLAQSAASAVLTTSKLGIVHANAGIKLQTRGGSFFLFVKGGVNRYDPERSTSSISGTPVVVSTFPTTVDSVVKGVFYPGGGIGFHAGPLGIRLDAGDEIYWDNGAHHNLRVTFGPTFRF